MPGKPTESLIVEAVNFAGLEMPPTGKLSDDKVATLTRWVSLGAPWPSRDRAAHAPSDLTKPAGSKFTALDRTLWSFQPVRRPNIPVPHGNTTWADWSSNPVDRFILKGLMDRGLTPAPEADRETLIRRATLT